MPPLPTERTPTDQPSSHPEPGLNTSEEVEPTPLLVKKPTPPQDSCHHSYSTIKQQLELAHKTIAINRHLLQKYGAVDDHDPNFLEKAFEDVGPGNNNTATATGTGTGHSLTTTAAINGSGNLIINTTGVPNTNPYSKRSSGETNGTNGSNANPNNSVCLLYTSDAADE